MSSSANETTLLLFGGTSPNVRKVGILLEELQLEYELRYVNVFGGEQFSPEFLAMNPLGKIPVLLDRAVGQPLFESGAILLFLAERHGRFLPTVAPARYEVMQWLMVQMSLMGPMLGQLAHFRGMLGSGRQPYAETRYAQQARKVLAVLDERLRSRAWIAGDDYSIADMAVYPWTVELVKQGFNADEFPALFLWRDRIGTRPAVIRARSRWEKELVARASQDRSKASDRDLDRFFGRSPDSLPADYSALRSWAPGPSK